MSTRSLAVSSDELQAAWQQVKSMSALSNPPEPKMPSFSSKTTMKARLVGIQSVISALEYNYTGTLFFDVNKNRSFKSIVSTAKDIMKEALPIQCLEAVFLGAFLTAGIPDLDRFPVSFKSMTGSTVHRHIILAVRHQQSAQPLQSKWGALGLSRAGSLMDKDLKFQSLSELVQDYCREFERVYHKVVKVYIGFPFSHDIHSSEKVDWRVLNLALGPDNWDDVVVHLDTFSKESADILEFKKAKGELPSSYAAMFPLHVPEAEPGKSSPEKRRHSSDTSLEFAQTMDNIAGALAPAVAAQPEKPEKVASPIIVAPDQIVFKQALADTAQVLPTNIFLQNTSTSAFLVEIEEPSGQIEVVTKSSAQGTKDSSTDNNGAASSQTSKSVQAAFRVSAKGMTAVAMKYTAKKTCNVDEQPAANNAVPPVPVVKETRVPGAKPGSRAAPAISNANVTKKGTTKAKVAETATPSKPLPSEQPRQVVILHCTRLSRAPDGSSNEVPDGEQFVLELPYTVKQG